VALDFATVFVFLALAVGFCIITFALSWLLRPKRPYAAKEAAYECGEEAEGTGWVQFNVRFYLVALFFIVFDVEIVFMLPWAVAFNEMLRSLGALAFVEMVVFVGILVAGLAYVWAKGDLTWVKTLTAREADELQPLSRLSSPGRVQGPGHRATAPAVKEAADLVGAK
jgi:NADH-quinone oxidoreductase subunit A